MARSNEPRIIRQNNILEEIRSFVIDRRARQLSERSVDFYVYHLNIFSKYCKAGGLESMEDITPDALRVVLDDYGRGHNKGGVHGLYRSIKAFLIWYERETDDPWRNPIRKVTAPKVKNVAIPGVSVDDVRKLCAACGRDPLGRRDRALFLFLFDSGVRLSECLALNLEDIDLETGTVRVLHGKGDKARVVYFSGDTAVELRRYLRGRSTDSPASPLWLDQRRKRMGPDCLRDILQRRGASCGMKDIPSAHDFRRGFALNMLRNGADLISVSRLLGHESLEVTKRYLALLDQDLERAHRQAGPLNNTPGPVVSPSRRKISLSSRG